VFQGSEKNFLLQYLNLATHVVLVMGKPYVCERRSPKSWEGSYDQSNYSETPDPFIGNIHLELWSTVPAWIWWPTMSFWSYLGYDLFLLLPPICPCGPTIATGKIKFPCLVHHLRFTENILLLISSKMKLCHHLLWAPQNRFLRKDLVFQGDAFSLFQWSTNVF